MLAFLLGLVLDVPDRDRGLALGVSPQQIQDAMYSAYGTRQVSTIFTPSNQYAVIVEIEPEFQRAPKLSQEQP